MVSAWPAPKRRHLEEEVNRVAASQAKAGEDPHPAKRRLTIDLTVDYAGPVTPGASHPVPKLAPSPIVDPLVRAQWPNAQFHGDDHVADARKAVHILLKQKADFLRHHNQKYDGSSGPAG